MKDSKSRRREIYNLTGGRCFYCGRKIAFENMQVDHFNPRSNNGAYSKNRVPSCADCNLIKSNKSIEDFRQTIESYLVKDIHVRMINKYMGIKKKKVKFFFEGKDFEHI